MSAEGTGRQADASTQGESEEKFQAIFAQAAIGIAQTGLDGEWLLVNDRFCQMLGYSQDELRTKTLQEISSPDDRAEVLAGRHKLLAGEISSHTMEKRYIRKDGSIFWGRLNRSIVRDDDNLPKYFISVVEDITDKIKAENALRDSEQRFRATFSQAAVGIAQTGLDGTWLLVNKRFSEMLGYSQDELRGRNVLDITHPDEREASSTAVRRLLEGEISSWSAEKRYVRRDGAIVCGRLCLSLVRDQHHLPQYFIGVVEDITERIQAEHALRESERRLQLALSAGVGLWDCDLRARSAALSPQYLSVFGAPPLSYREWMMLIHPDDRDRVVALARDGVARTHEWEAEFRVLWPDGSLHWMLSKAKVILGDDGLPDRMVGVSLDITERKRSEEVLRVSQERFDLAQEASGTSTWDWDATTGETHCSSGHGPLYGLPSGDRGPAFEEWLRLIYPEDRARMREELGRTLGSADRFIAEFRVVWPDGTIHWLYGKGQVFRDSQGNPIRMIGANMDISERKAAEAALRESEERFRTLADTAPVMICISGPDKLATFFNAVWLTFTGRTMEQEVGYGWIEGVHRDDVDACLANYISSFEGRRKCHLEYRLRRADGEYRSVVCDGVPRFTADGVLVGYIASCVDITDLKRAQEQALARQKLESLGVLAGGIAHDFNNLLGAILGQAELLEQELSGSSPSEEIQRIKTVVIRGAEIVRELMIYAGQEPASPSEPVDLSLLVEEMIELLKVSISKHAVLNVNLQKNLPGVLGNAPQIRQVVMNLVINASEAIGEKEGVIRVATSCVTESQDLGNNAATLPRGDYVRLEVSDTGCGLTDDDKAKIFDPFFTTKFAGRGLGLAVVQGIVRAQGGAIDVISAPGQGATFRVVLPSTSRGPLEIQNSMASSGARQSKAPAWTVLVVEDEELLLRAVSKVLRQRGFSVIDVSDGSTAINLIRTCKDNIDLIVLDVTLPGRSSREVFEEARRVRPEVKTVLTSAYGKEYVDATFAGLQVDHFIRKPFQLSELVACLQGALTS